MVDFTKLLEWAPDSLYLLDPDTSRIEWCNRMAHESLGYTAEEILGHSVLSLQMDVTGLPAWEQIAAEIRQADPYVFVGRHRHKLGHEVAVEVYTRTVVLGEKSYFLSAARDITGRLMLQNSMTSRDQHVQFALNEASDGLWDWNVCTGEVFFSPQLKRLLGYGPHEMTPTLSTWSDNLHPEDAPRVNQALDHHMKGLRERYEAEYRLRNRNGHYLWVHDRGRIAERNPRGQPTRVVGMVRNISDQKALEARLLQEATRDSLTGLYNRRESEEALHRLRLTCQQQGQTLGVCIMDLDHFKQINDVYGHLVGDEVLATVARCIASQLKPGDSVFRWGGEEFLLLCPGTHLPDLESLAHQLRTAIHALQWPHVHALRGVTASFGITEMPVGGASAQALLLAADAALYKAKANGRNQVVTQTCDSSPGHP